MHGKIIYKNITLQNKDAKWIHADWKLQQYILEEEWYLKLMMNIWSAPVQCVTCHSSYSENVSDWHNWIVRYWYRYKAQVRIPKYYWKRMTSISHKWYKWHQPALKGYSPLVWAGVLVEAEAEAEAEVDWIQCKYLRPAWDGKINTSVSDWQSK